MSQTGLPTYEDLVGMVNRLQGQVTKMTNAAPAPVSVTNGLDGKVVTYTSGPTANADDSIEHTLGRVPSGYIVLSQSAPGTLYTGANAPTATKHFLRSTTAKTSYTVLFH